MLIATVASAAGLFLTLLATAWAAIAAGRSAKAAERAILVGSASLKVGEASLCLQREAYEWQLRAYVVFVQPLIERRPDGGFQVKFDMKNVGQTPTRHASVRAGYYLETVRMEDTFDFPEPAQPAHPTVIGAGQTRSYVGPSLSSADFNKVSTGLLHYYVYGWMIYRDVFSDTPDRRTEFCYKFETNSQPGGGWAWIAQQMFNGSDEECYKR